MGRYRRVHCEGHVLVYERYDGEERLFVVLNFGEADESAPLTGAGTVLLSTHLDREGESVRNAVSLRAHEGVVVAVE